MNAATGITGLGQVGLVVEDLDRATAFYRDVLGLKHLFTAAGMAFFDLGGLRLMLGQASERQPRQPASLLYYKVSDIDAAVAALEARGVAIEQGPLRAHVDERHELWLAFFPDMDGNRLALMEERMRGA